MLLFLHLAVKRPGVSPLVPLRASALLSEKWGDDRGCLVGLLRTHSANVEDAWAMPGSQ